MLLLLLLLLLHCMHGPVTLRLPACRCPQASPFPCETHVAETRLAEIEERVPGSSTKGSLQPVRPRPGGGKGRMGASSFLHRSRSSSSGPSMTQRGNRLCDRGGRNDGWRVRPATTNAACHGVVDLPPKPASVPAEGPAGPFILQGVPEPLQQSRGLPLQFPAHCSHQQQQGTVQTKHTWILWHSSTLRFDPVQAQVLLWRRQGPAARVTAQPHARVQQDWQALPVDGAAAGPAAVGIGGAGCGL